MKVNFWKGKETVKEKIMTLCKSGADPDPEVHKKKGGNVDEDIAYQYLRYFEMDDEKLEKIKINGRLRSK